MTYEEALRELDEAVKDRIIAPCARDEYSKLCDTPEGREAFGNILYSARIDDCKTKERKANRAARKAASQGKGGAA